MNTRKRYEMRMNEDGSLSTPEIGDDERWPKLGSPEDAARTHAWARELVLMWEAEKAELEARVERLTANGGFVDDAAIARAEHWVLYEMDDGMNNHEIVAGVIAALRGSDKITPEMIERGARALLTFDGRGGDYDSLVNQDYWKASAEAVLRAALGEEAA